MYDGNMAIKFLVSDRFRFYGDSDALSKCLIGIKYYHYDTEIRSVTFSYLDKKGYFFSAIIKRQLRARETHFRLLYARCPPESVDFFNRPLGILEGRRYHPNER